MFISLEKEQRKRRYIFLVLGLVIGIPVLYAGLLFSFLGQYYVRNVPNSTFKVEILLWPLGGIIIIIAGIIGTFRGQREKV